jgi:hypothetical protein
MRMFDRRCCPRMKVQGLSGWLPVPDSANRRYDVLDFSRKSLRLESSLFLAPGMTVQVVLTRTDTPRVTRLAHERAQVVRSTPDELVLRFVEAPRASAALAIAR